MAEARPCLVTALSPHAPLFPLPDSDRHVQGPPLPPNARERPPDLPTGLPGPALPCPPALLRSAQAPLAMPALPWGLERRPGGAHRVPGPGSTPAGPWRPAPGGPRCPVLSPHWYVGGGPARPSQLGAHPRGRAWRETRPLAASCLWVHPGAAQLTCCCWWCLGASPPSWGGLPTGWRACSLRAPGLAVSLSFLFRVSCSVCKNSGGRVYSGFLAGGGVRPAFPSGKEVPERALGPPENQLGRGGPCSRGEG